MVRFGGLIDAMEKNLDIKEIQKDLSDYLAKKYGQRVQFAGFGAVPQPEGEKVGEGEAEKKTTKKTIWPWHTGS